MKPCTLATACPRLMRRFCCCSHSAC
jgi:hypothetical protein